jgi:hypothetical protein
MNSPDRPRSHGDPYGAQRVPPVPSTEHGTPLASSSPVKSQRGRATPLPFFRRFSRNAWILHGYLIGVLCLLPVSSSVRAEETEHVLQSAQYWLNLSVGGVSGQSGASAVTSVNVTVEGVETWYDPVSGNSYSITRSPVPASGASVSSDWGYVSGSAGSAGQCTITGTIGSDDVTANVSASMTQNGSMVSASTSFFVDCTTQQPPPPETWIFRSHEERFEVSVSTTDATTGVPAGTQAEVVAQVKKRTWDVVFSSLDSDRTDIVNELTSDVTNVALEWATRDDWNVHSPSSVSLPVSYSADYDGFYRNVFWMGSSSTTLEVKASVGSAVAIGRLRFERPAMTGPEYSHHKTVYSLNTATTPVIGIQPGTSQAFTGNVQQCQYEVLLSPTGTFIERSAGPWTAAASLPVRVSSSGGVVFANANSSTPTQLLLTTDVYGYFSGEFTAGETVGSLSFLVANSPSISASVNVIPYGAAAVQPFFVDSYYTYAMTGPDSAIHAEDSSFVPFMGKLELREIVVYGDNVHEWASIVDVTPVPDVEIVLQVQTGEGELQQTSVVTGSDGVFQSAFRQLHGNSVSVVYARAVMPEQAETFAHSFYFSAGEEVWTTISSDVVRVVGVGSNAYSVTPNVNESTLTVSVRDEVWLMQTSNFENTRETLDPGSSTPVSGEMVTWSLDHGISGSLNVAQSYTDSNGLATAVFVPTAAPGAAVQIGVNGELHTIPITVSAEHWPDWEEVNTVYVLVEPIGLTNPATPLELNDQVTLRATVTYESYQQRTSNYLSYKRQEIGTGPAEGAGISWEVTTPNGGTIVPVAEQDVTDPSGQAWAVFTQGAVADAEVLVTTPYLGAHSSGTYRVDAVNWQYVSAGEELLITLAPPTYPPEALETEVKIHTWESWTRDGVLQKRYETYGPAIGSSVQVQRVSGTGHVQAPNGTAAENGRYVTSIAADTGAVFRGTATWLGMTASIEFTAPTGIGELDSDGDGLSNATELALGTNPWAIDTDGDGMLDGDEVAQGMNPLVHDGVALGVVMYARTALAVIH